MRSKELSSHVTQHAYLLPNLIVTIKCAQIQLSRINEYEEMIKCFGGSGQEQH
jgi:hypothetical protein